MVTQAYYLPQSIDEATSLLAEYGSDLMVMAGGTLAMPLVNEGISMPERVMGLRRAGLDYLEKSGGILRIGATTTLSQMERQNELPLLAEAAKAVGGWAIRNMATVGGNLFAPPPSGDFATALLALNADIYLVSKRGERSLPLKDFYTGFLANVLAPDELLKEITVDIPEGKTSFLKYGRRHANTPAIVTVASVINIVGNGIRSASIALGGVGPHPLRAKLAEEYLIGKPLDGNAITNAKELATASCEPFTDAIASEWYRRKMIPVIFSRALDQIAH
jgi:CO/xanthine dehydrogenase FAD-binding subunit